MTTEAFKKHKVFAGEKKPSMLRRRVGHDYEQRCVYLVTMTVEGRRPLLGRLVGDAGAESGSLFAGEKKPSMLRRRVGHDYEQRCVYLVTMTVEGRRPLLGRLVGNAGAESGSSDAPHIELSPLGKQVREMWEAISEYYPEVRVLATMVMPDHLHGIPRHPVCRASDEPAAGNGYQGLQGWV